MEIIYYFDADSNICPVKEYLKQYSINDQDSYETKERKSRIFAEISKKIEFVNQNQGRPVGKISTAMHGYGFFEIKTRKNKNIVIRVLYFRHEDKIVLLNAFEKPDNYNDKKTNQDINRQLKLTENYLNKFKLNPTSYEAYK